MQAFDLILLAFKGITVASLPLALVWLARPTAQGGDRLRKLAWVTAFFTFDLVVFGAFTRLTDSGLGCPDWPGCYAKANPFMASNEIRSAEAAMPLGPVSMSKAWIEMIHRYLAMAVGLMIIVMLVVSIRRVRRANGRRAGAAWLALPAHPRMAAMLLGLVVLQGAFGAWTVTQKLQPLFVTTHLLLGLTLLASLIWHALRFGGRMTASERVGPLTPSSSRGLRRLAIIAAATVVVQVALGGWVSANYAVLACDDFPKCQGVWIPSMDFANGFHLWRHLGFASDGTYLGASALTAIHWTHRAFAALVFVVGGALAWRLAQVGRWRSIALVLSALLVGQVTTGAANVLFDWPLVAAVLHNAGAAGLVACLVVINYGLHSTARNALAPSLDRAAFAARGVPLYRQEGA